MCIGNWPTLIEWEVILHLCVYVCAWVCVCVCVCARARARVCVCVWCVCVLVWVCCTSFCLPCLSAWQVQVNLRLTHLYVSSTCPRSRQIFPAERRSTHVFFHTRRECADGSDAFVTGRAVATPVTSLACDGDTARVIRIGEWSVGWDARKIWRKRAIWVCWILTSRQGHRVIPEEHALSWVKTPVKPLVECISRDR